MLFLLYATPYGEYDEPIGFGKMRVSIHERFSLPRFCVAETASPRTGMVKNTSVRARQFIADALRKMFTFSLVLAPRDFPFKGIGVSREKVRFRLVKVTKIKRTRLKARLFAPLTLIVVTIRRYCCLLCA